MSTVFTCNACNKELHDESEQKLHYKSEWHRYNLKRKVAGVPGVTESLFLARQSALPVDRNKSSVTPMLFCCGLCNKGYRSSQAHSQHLKSRSHMIRASQETGCSNVERAIIKPLPQRVSHNHLPQQTDDDEEEESEWEEVDSEEDNTTEAVDSMNHLKVDEVDEDVEMDEDEDEDEEETDDILLDPLRCFMCDLEHDTLENCMVHMHKKHGFFIPDIEYLKDPKGFLTYIGLKVKKDLLCLYCNHRRFPFASLEAVRKHMEAKSHCKVHYGDGGDDEEVELEDFYDYSSSYMNEDGKEDEQQIVTADDMKNNIELGNGGSELVITQKRTADGVVSTKMLGSREFLRYYRQKPKPTPANHAVIAALASRYRSMGLVTTLSREKQMVRMKVLKQMNRSGVEQMRSKMGMKSNVINNLPNNVPY